MYAGEQTSPMATVAKKHYSVRETYWIAHGAARTVGHFARLRARGPRFAERIMLAVTEVNGCALCAYGHTRFALDAGVSRDEIRELLGGVADGVPEVELPAVVFAQHYADTRGHPEQRVWRNLVDVYGEDQALEILGTARMMMCGNALGIPWSALLSRLRGTPYPGSSLRKEVGTIVGATVVMPVAVARARFAESRGEPVLSFEGEQRPAA